MNVSSKANAAAPKLVLQKSLGKWPTRMDENRRLAITKSTDAAYKLAPATMLRKTVSSM
jgi:hypothetical protein